MMAEWDQPDVKITERAEDPTVNLPARLRLVVIAGPDTGKSIEVGRGAHRIGTFDKCELVLSDRRVSRQHLELRVGDDGVVLTDLESTNGSFYRGQRFRQITIGVGVVVTIGESELMLRDADAAASATERDHFGELRGTSSRMREVYALLDRVARSDASVLIQGETGTGKELCAAALHAASARSRGPFVICDLGGVNRSLIESELFGHVRGAFTGADRDRKGAFEEADGGTIFLDEIGEVDLEVQPRLLRALENRHFKRVGGARFVDVDVRVVAATNRDLNAEQKAGRFRQDLFHRLSVITIALPPLRERREDVPLLVEHFIAGRDVDVPPETMRILTDYDWPGNVRELRNVIERSLSFAGESRTLAPRLLGLSSDTSSVAAAVAAEPDVDAGFRDAKNRLIRAFELDYVTRLLKRTEGNVSKAARISGIDRVSLHRLMRKHGLGGSDGK